MKNEGQNQLKKENLSLLTVVSMIFCLCAAGAFGIEDMLSSLGPGLSIAMLVILPIIFGYPMALVCAELGAVIPEEGGFYVWVKEACGEFWGFQAGWWRAISIYIDNTLYVILAGGYITMALSLSNIESFGIKVLMIVIFTYINLRSLKGVGMWSKVLALLVVVAFGFVAIVGFMNWNQSPFEPFMIEGESFLMTAGAGLAIGMWMYCGYESMSTMAGEMSNPQLIPKALVITIPLIAAVYIIPTIASLASLGHWDEWGTSGGYSYADVLTTYLGPAFGVGFAIVAVLANCSIYNTYIASGSRSFFVLAEDRLCPPILAKVSKRGVPSPAIIMMAIVNIILCSFAFEVVVVIGVFVYMLSQIMIMIAGVILRKKIPNRDGLFKIKLGYTGFFIMSMLPIAIMFMALYMNGIDYFVGGIVGIMSGPIAYFIFKRRYGGLNTIDSKKYPINPKTKLGINDMKHLSNICFIMMLIAALGIIFFPWYEGSWGAEYYFDTYGIENMFEIFQSCIKYGTVILLALGVIFRVMHNKYNKELN